MDFVYHRKNEVEKPSKKRFSWTIDESKYLSIEDVTRLRETCLKERDIAVKRHEYIPVRDWFMVELGLNAGFRVREMANLRVADLFIDENQSSISTIGKGGKKRVVRISKRFKKSCLWFLAWKQGIGQSITPDSPVLTAQNGRKLTTRALENAFKRCGAKAGIASHYSIHCLRHTYGSYLYVSSGHNLRLVQEQLGHSSVKITEVYASVMDVDAKQAVERLYR